ncbi:MAG: hypothetical protein M0C28_44165 [Candidatus Moduliflexus flocculans]|nr:hypothetical protein [Candidatus Moduliflexus flocculans]
MLNPQLSRREFLKLATTGSLAFALSDLKLDRALAAPASNRDALTISGVPLYDAPTFNANTIFNFGKDKVVDITAVEENGDEGNPFNRAWYQVNNEGYTYSGWVLPVETRYQKPLFDIPQKGRVGEITVPFVDTKKAPYVYAERGYRVYYGSTHWVKRVMVTREEKSIWYEIYDSEVKRYLYVPSHSMRLVPYE